MLNNCLVRMSLKNLVADDKLTTPQIWNKFSCFFCILKLSRQKSSMPVSLYSTYFYVWLIALHDYKA